MLRVQKVKVVLIIVSIFILLTLVVLIINFFRTPSSEQALNAVFTFYKYEQEGNFAASWEMFHPYMQERFSRGNYIENRSHVFMNHFGVETFTFDVGKVEKNAKWVMEEGIDPIANVYAVPIHQHFSGTYGKFTVTQIVYATEVDDEWKLLWDYSD